MLCYLFTYVGSDPDLHLVRGTNGLWLPDRLTHLLQPVQVSSLQIPGNMSVLTATRAGLASALDLMPAGQATQSAHGSVTRAVREFAVSLPRKHGSTDCARKLDQAPGFELSRWEVRARDLSLSLSQITFPEPACNEWSA